MSKCPTIQMCQSINLSICQKQSVISNSVWGLLFSSGCPLNVFPTSWWQSNAQLLLKLWLWYKNVNYEWIAISWLFRIITNSCHVVTKQTQASPHWNLISKLKLQTWCRLSRNLFCVEPTAIQSKASFQNELFWRTHTHQSKLPWAA